MMFASSFPIINRAPLKTDLQLLGIRSHIGIGRAFLWVVYLLNMLVLALLCRSLAKGQTELQKIVYTSLAMELCGFVLNQTISRVVGVFSLIPIWLIGIILLKSICGLDVKRSSAIARVYYLYQAISFLILRTLIS